MIAIAILFVFGDEGLIHFGENYVAYVFIALVPVVFLLGKLFNKQ